MDVKIPSPDNFEILKKRIKDDGYDNLHILADFDRTFTYGSVDGVKTPSVISQLRDGKHLSKGYSKKAHELFDKYFPIENDPKVIIEDKKRFMNEWWTLHFKLLIESGLNKNDLSDIVENGIVRFRDGVREFLGFLNESNIPILILSANGVGDTIEMYLNKIGCNYSNVYIITNRFNWDENGNAVSVIEPIINTYNKDETIIKEINEIYEKVKNRKNVILIGDSVGDIGMIEGFEFKSLIKLGFLNYEPEKLLKEYEDNYDIVLIGDCDFSFINNLISELK